MRHSLHAAIRFHGDLVDEVFVEPGQRLRIGPGGAMFMPVPSGGQFVATAEWRGRSVEVVDGKNRSYDLVSKEVLTFAFGPHELTFRLAPRVSLRRTTAVPWAGSMALLTGIMAMSLMGSQSAIAYKYRCELAFSPWLWAKMSCPVYVSVNGQANGNKNSFNAEYLARLLKRDYEGDEDGRIQRTERPKTNKDTQSFYMPAGNDGPITDMGGAEDTAPEPVRTPPTEQDLQPSPQQGSKKEVLTVENGTEVELESGEGDNDNPIVAESDSTGDADEFETPPAEENEGWGIPDWYDASDQALEDLEIRVMLEHSKRRLVIDPNDHDALAILSYYQYLAMDYGAAEGTYDRQIHLQPDDSSAYNNKALIYKRRGQYKVEEALYRQALALAPNDPTALNNLAVCLSHQGRHEEAMEVMRQLEALDPNDAYADLHRSKIYAEMGEQDQALEYLDRALKGMKELDTLHHIEFRQDIRVDPSFGRLRENYRFKAILVRYYDKDSPLMEEG